MAEIVQEFRWAAVGAGGKYVWGREGYLVMDGNAGEGAVCSRRFSEPITGPGDTIEIGMRVVLGKEYALRIYDAADHLVLECRIDPEGWIHFREKEDLQSVPFYLTWFRGRPCVDPEFVPGRKDPTIAKTVESDEQLYRFGRFDFARQTFAFALDDLAWMEVADAFLSPARELARFELAALPSALPGNQIRLGRFQQSRTGQVIDQETFPLYWEPIPEISPGYPDDNTRAASTRPVGYRWLECIGEYCWVKARLPEVIAEGELDFEMMTPDVEKETCLELHQWDGTMAQGMWPVKVGIMKAKFFSGFVSSVYSPVVKRFCWKSQQTWYADLRPKPDTPYRIRIVWDRRGRYRWWVNDQPMTFSGVAKTGTRFEFPGLETPGHEVPFLNELVAPRYRGIDTISLHYGLVTPALHRAYFGGFHLRGSS